MERSMRRHGQGKRIDHGIDDNGAVPMRKRLSETLSNVAGFLNANPFCAHRLGNFGEIRVPETHAEGDDTGLLLLDIDEVERREW